MDIGSLKKDIETIIINIKEDFSKISNKELPGFSDRTALLAAMETLYKKMVIFDHICSQESSRSTLNTNNVIEEKVVENSTIAEIVVENEIVEPVSEIIDSETVIDLKEEAPIVEVIEEPVFATVVVETKIEDIPPKKEPKTVLLPDIKSNIGINDKFQFIADLFQNNSEKYEAAIKQLNSFNTKDSSLLFVEELRQQYKWKEDDYTAQQLTNIVTRRFL